MIRRCVRSGWSFFRRARKRAQSCSWRSCCGHAWHFCMEPLGGSLAYFNLSSWLGWASNGFGSFPLITASSRECFWALSSICRDARGLSLPPWREQAPRFSPSSCKPGSALRLGPSNRYRRLRLFGSAFSRWLDVTLNTASLRIFAGKFPRSRHGDSGTFEPPRVCRRPFCLSHAAMAGSSSCA